MVDWRVRTIFWEFIYKIEICGPGADYYFNEGVEGIESYIIIFFDQMISVLIRQKLILHTK